jgi:AcrR family transcriptional regulator
VSSSRRPTSSRLPLSRPRILAAALDLVDREGLDALTMRRLGAELGCEAMSLYNHIPDRAAILDGLFEVVLDELPAVAVKGPWQAWLRGRAKDLRAVLRRHPNTLAVLGSRPAVTPAAIKHVEDVLAVLRGAGFSVASAVSAMQVLFAYVVGHTIATCSPGEIALPAYDELPGNEYPHVMEAAKVIATSDVEKEFAFGLDAMLAGLAKHAKR